MNEKKRSKNSEIAQLDIEFNKSVEELADALLDGLEEDFRSDLESFDSYRARMKTEILENMDEFRNRFIDGYKLLIEELTILYGSAKELEQQTPPGAIKL